MACGEPRQRMAKVCAFLLVKRMTLPINLAILQQNTFNSKYNEKIEVSKFDAALCGNEFIIFCLFR